MCHFCSVYNNKYNQRSEDFILEESEFFYLKAALGQFVEGYVLIISKDHFKNFSELSESEYLDLKSFIQRIRLNLEKLTAKKSIIFEHGTTYNDKGGACIDHAHLHVIPTNVDILPELSNKFNAIKIKSINELANQANVPHIPYLFYENQNGIRYLFKTDSPIPSQYVRRVLANSMNMKKEWDWKSYPFLENIKKFNSIYYRWVSDNNLNH